MEILFVSYEAAPFYQTGGLGEVARFLPLALAHLGIHVTLVIPYYSDVKISNIPELIDEFEIEFAGANEKVKIYEHKISDKINLLLIHNPYLSKATEKHEKAEKFILFAKSVAYIALFGDKKKYPKYDLIHLNDWHAGIVAVFMEKLKGLVVNPPSILTIHNLAYQGRLEKKKLRFLLNITEKEGDIGTLLEAGVHFANHITTVSPTYAKEITHSKLGYQMRWFLNSRGKNVIGILNGIDNNYWNPGTDRFIYKKFSLKNLADGKKQNKEKLIASLGLSHKDNSLVSYIGRLEPNQKGIDLIYKAVKDLLRTVKFNVVILGKGDIRWVMKIGELVRKFPGNVYFANRFDEELSHRIYAGSDIMLIPSKYEPCGLVQMIGMRYGALPLVRETGGLADTVKDGVNGFSFKTYSPTTLERTLGLALKEFIENPDKISKMREIALKEDFSWDTSAKKYKELYNKIITLKKS